RKLVRQGKNLEELYTVLEMLVMEQPLPVKYRDHMLTGNWRGRRECHIRPDWLLIYKVEEQTLYLERSGSHSELFS
ncbi:MAG: type II toxin-antitoxin system YafQ family toxin, partial [Flammeovirgaceae bacterium]